MDDEPEPARAAPDSKLTACWPLLAAEAAEWAERLALATVVATLDPAEGFAAAWAGVTVITGTARALAILGPEDATAWQQARPYTSALVRALSDAPSLPGAGRLIPGQASCTTCVLGDARPVIANQGCSPASSIRCEVDEGTAVINVRTGLIMLCRHLARTLSVVSFHATCSTDQAAASNAAEHAERLTAALCSIPAPGPQFLEPTWPSNRRRNPRRAHWV